MRCIIFIALILGAAGIASAEGIGISPSSLEIDMDEGSAEKLFYIFNPNDLDIIYNVESESGMISVSESEGRIYAHGKKSVRVKALKAGRSRLKVNIAGSENGSSISAGAYLDIYAKKDVRIFTARNIMILSSIALVIVSAALIMR